MKRLTPLLAMIFGLALVGQAQADGPIYWKNAGQPVLVEPETIFVSSGTGSGTFSVSGLEWAGWGTAEARATGTAHVKDCRPSCATGGLVDRQAKVTMYWVNSQCGNRRYRNIKIKIFDKPRAWTWGPSGSNCRGAQILRPFPQKPLPRPKPKLKRKTAKSLYKRTMESEFPFLEGRRAKYIRCSRAARLRMKCRGKWTYPGAYDHGISVGVWKTRGWVKRNGRNYKVRIRAKHWITYPNESFPTTGPMKYTASGWFVRR